VISLAHSTVNDKVRANVNSALDDNRLGQGRFIKEFEDAVAKFVGVKHAIAVSNGSMADMVALSALKAQRPEKTEVIVPALTFIAQTNSILINGLKPVFVDVGYDYQMSIADLQGKVNENTLAIFPAHLMGRKADMVSIKELARKFDTFVIEDACEGFGIFEGSDFGTFSFFPSHTITTGEGGMVITNNDLHAEFARKVSNHGRKSDDILEKFHFDCFGFNGKMSNVLAAIGCAVVEDAGDVIRVRQSNVTLYNSLLERNWFAESPHGYPMLCKTTEERDAILIRLWENGVEARKFFSCLPTKEYKYGGSYPNAEDIGARGLFLPAHQGLTEEDVQKIVSLLS